MDMYVYKYVPTYTNPANDKQVFAQQTPCGALRLCFCSITMHGKSETNAAQPFSASLCLCKDVNSQQNCQYAGERRKGETN